MTLTAFQDVQDDLIASQILTRQEALLRQASIAADKSEASIRNQYQAGTVVYTDVVTAQATALTARRALIQAQSDRQNAAVALVQALGGGWSTADLAKGSRWRSRRRRSPPAALMRDCVSRDRRCSSSRRSSSAATRSRSGRARPTLLDAIAQHGSISAAARALGMSYRRAWLLVDTMNRCWAEPLVETAAGGSKGGGARISEAGRAVLAEYRALELAIEIRGGRAGQTARPTHAGGAARAQGMNRTALPRASYRAMHSVDPTGARHAPDVSLPVPAACRYAPPSR